MYLFNVASATELPRKARKLAPRTKNHPNKCYAKLFLE